ncbi:MAG: 1-acyl-sn-glycerol-3-phosphate acyltransferase [Bacteroidetes bacterium]|nr:1-acyl-sn-glycerol-3-phosphate acyltransferase [Bacteroidota bacterium]MBU1485078.1 1-acyl-sn-glycerol-3-phosphate acyltransferase [Bacteroidota bacterium]MBU2046050.1 1-acyl-sn-glycerol-3-phosphate acyltransferase [Bacteroidota bacterium]MBU2269424.1 1-acyl-sn-glycerol-3-phosphate acyltransferase [Bacteroidota bacterium]MBU2377326.1 1-acyl-sn-glycerol-3-phosphate acyltransferase [Bacteroidota bacterium]
MTYFLFYHLLKITCKLYFRKIRVYHSENIHPNKPLIICANHGNSFMDAILMAIIFKRKIHFLARADAFNTPFKNWFLSKINMMPIYRIKDGREEVKNNDAIFDKCQKILENNGAILIFPEGNCVVEKRLRTFKTGFVHLAFEGKVKDLLVLPVTINYTNPYAFYSEVSFEFAKPIGIEALKGEKNYISFSKLLLEKVRNEIAKNMIIIPSKEDDLFFEQLLLIIRNNGISESEFIKKQIKYSESICQIKEDNLLIYNDLKIKTELYFKQVEQYHVSDKIIKQKSVKGYLFVFYPIYLLGYLLNYIPSYVIKNKIEKSIKESQFLGAVRMVAGMFIYLIYVPIIIVFLAFIVGSYFWTMAFILLIIFFYYFTFESYQQLKESHQLGANDEIYEGLRKKRSELVAAINLLL